ncbi:YadA-like family protein [Pasteurella multocida]|uniref:YadA-like family protein n=1 Tax=Pasteurella multocida TaxID=747 RepID=UPI003CF23C97
MARLRYPDIIARDAKYTALAELGQRLPQFKLSPIMTTLVDLLDDRFIEVLADKWSATGYDGLFLATTQESKKGLNGDMTKLIKLSRDLGPHIKAIEDNSIAIKTSTEQSLPSTFVNLLATAPKEILKTANSALEYAADSSMAKSSDYQEAKKKIDENGEAVLEQKRQLDTVKQTSQQNKKATEKMQKDLLVVKQSTEEKFEQQNTLLLTTTHQVEQNVTDVESTRQKVSKLQQQYHQLQTSIEENRALSSRGIASIAAMANIPVLALVGKTTIGAGVGRFDTKNAVAVGVSRYYENGVAVKVSLGTAGAKVTLGGGVSQFLN